MRNSILFSVVALMVVASPALADKKKRGGNQEPPPAAAPAPADPGKGALKPGQAVGVRACLGSTAGVNVDATDKTTVGVATCRGALQKAFVQKGLCKKGVKLEYSWQFADTTGMYSFVCP